MFNPCLGRNELSTWFTFFRGRLLAGHGDRGGGRHGAAGAAAVLPGPPLFRGSWSVPVSWCCLLHPRCATRLSSPRQRRAAGPVPGQVGVPCPGSRVPRRGDGPSYGRAWLRHSARENLLRSLHLRFIANAKRESRRSTRFVRSINVARGGKKKVGP